MKRNAYQWAWLVLFLSMISVCYITIPATAQTTSQQKQIDHQPLHLSLYYVTRGDLCLNHTDYNTCNSIRTYTKLHPIIVELNQANFTCPPSEISYSGQHNANLGNRISNYNNQVNSGVVEYKDKKSILITIDSSPDSTYSAKITRYSYSNPSCSYETEKSIGNGSWFNHQAAEYFHPSRNCIWKITYNGKEYLFKFIP
ncbi:hypothetical protein [Solidesulfovibrio sp. C21]|uniref:hypothetical protein n=1 Tax=Solidesulfovibrio sp. C21 TaxID=3398613 RepID=UPI0039FDA1D4